MTLFIDGDALPNLLKPILLRTIERKALTTWVISNKRITLGESPLITYLIIDQGLNVADDRIVEMARQNDLIITADIPLADRIIAKEAHALDHRGELFTKDNIKSYLAMRNLMEEIRNSGEKTRGPAPFGTKDAHAFASQLDRFLTRRLAQKWFMQGA